MINIRNQWEIDLIRKSSKIVRDTLNEVSKYIKPGISTLELDTIAEEFIISKNAIPGFKGLYGFPSTLCISIDNEVVHGIPSNRNIKEGEIISLDVGAIVEGYYGDHARSFPVGDISKEKHLV